MTVQTYAANAFSAAASSGVFHRTPAVFTSKQHPKNVRYFDGLNGVSSIVRHADALHAISAFNRAEYCAISAGAA